MAELGSPAGVLVVGGGVAALETLMRALGVERPAAPPIVRGPEREGAPAEPPATADTPALQG